MNETLTILLIDDDEINNFYVEHVLQKNCNLGELHVALDGIEGLQKIQELHAQNKPIDIILLDINMPMMNGFDFLNEYETLPASMQAKQLVSIIASGKDSPDFKKLKTSPCVNTIFEKPLTEEKLISITVKQ